MTRRPPTRTPPPRSPLDPPMDSAQVDALRDARMRVVNAGRAQSDAAIATAVTTYARAMIGAGFGRGTVAALVYAALDTGLPLARGATRRAQRRHTLHTWAVRAASLADA